MCDHLFVVTGGPGTGKSTLIEALARHGIGHMPEAGRAIIRDQVNIGGPALPWGDRALYAELMLGWELRSYHEAEATGLMMAETYKGLGYEVVELPRANVEERVAFVRERVG